MSDLEERKNRYNSIDFLKGIACIAVVLIHVQFPGKMGFAVRQISRFAVPSFFLISGFFFRSPKSQLATTARKLRHAMLLFLGAMFFLLALSALGIGGISLRAYVHGFLRLPDLLRFFISNAPYQWPHLWFLGALVYIYLFALLWFGDGRRLQTAGPLGVVLLACMTAFQEFAEWLPFNPILPISGIQIPFFVLFIFRGLPFFLLGIWLRTQEDSLHMLQMPSFANTVLVIGGAILAILEAKWTVGSQFYIGNYLMISGMFLWAVRNPSSGYHPLVFVGRNLSMPVYIVHITAARWIGGVLLLAGIEDNPAVHWAMPIFVLCLSLALATIFHVARTRLHQ